MREKYVYRSKNVAHREKKKTKCYFNKKERIKNIVAFAIIQLLIFFVFLFAFKNTFPLDIEDTTQVVIKVEQKVIGTAGKHAPKLVLISTDGKRYTFVGNPSEDPSLSVRELRNLIDVGDEISLLYHKYGFRNDIVEAISGQNVYRTLEEYNESKQTMPTVICFVLLESIYLFMLYIYIHISSPTAKKKKRHKKQTKDKTNE